MRYKHLRELKVGDVIVVSDISVIRWTETKLCGSCITLTVGDPWIIFGHPNIYDEWRYIIHMSGRKAEVSDYDLLDFFEPMS